MALNVPDDSGLAGKVAIVTGGGAAGDGIGNGRAAAILLGTAGVRVVVVDRDGGLAKRTVEMIGEAGGQALALEADVTRAAVPRRMAAARPLPIPSPAAPPPVTIATLPARPESSGTFRATTFLA